MKAFEFFYTLFFYIMNESRFKKKLIKLKKKNWVFTFVWSLWVIPVEHKDQWQVLSYRKIPSHQIQFSSSGMEIKVNKSASPVIYPVSPVRIIKGVQVTGQIEGGLNIPQGKTQGTQGADDFVFRLGLVVKGNKKLSWIQRQVAADWVKQLFKLAPPDRGIEKIYFLNVVQQSSEKGKERIHPLSSLIEEKNVWELAFNKEIKKQSFSWEYLLSQPLEIVALWISSDGDDTQSQFTLWIKNLQLII